tara:strand:- start:480 stop:2066 length:1587 start_codon:yes stop_codon:yes gene_type:complete
MADDDSYVDSWWNSLSDEVQYETKVKWKRQQQERRMSKARVASMFVCDSFADGVLALPARLFTHRKLACTCKEWAGKVHAHYATMSILELHDEDALEGNAAFVVGPLRTLNRELILRFVFPQGGHCSVHLNRWMDRHALLKDHPLEDRESESWRVEADGMSFTTAFFLGRAIAALKVATIAIPSPRLLRYPFKTFTACTALLKNPGQTHRIFDSHAARRCSTLGFQAIAGCARIAAKARLRTTDWIQNAILDLRDIYLDDEGARWLTLQLYKDFTRQPPRVILLDQTLSPLSLGLLGVLQDNGCYLWERVDVSKLEELSLVNCRLDEHLRMSALCKCLTRVTLQRLTTLSLAGARMGPDGMRLLAPHFQSNAHCNKLVELDLSHNRLGRQGLSIFKQYAMYMPMLREIDVTENQVPFVGDRDFLLWVGQTAMWYKIDDIRLDYNVGNGELRIKAMENSRARCAWSQITGGMYSRVLQGDSGLDYTEDSDNSQEGEEFADTDADSEPEEEEEEEEDVEEEDDDNDTFEP